MALRRGRPDSEAIHMRHTRADSGAVAIRQTTEPKRRKATCQNGDNESIRSRLEKCVLGIIT